MLPLTTPSPEVKPSSPEKTLLIAATLNQVRAMEKSGLKQHQMNSLQEKVTKLNPNGSPDEQYLITLFKIEYLLFAVNSPSEHQEIPNAEEIKGELLTALKLKGVSSQLANTLPLAPSISSVKKAEKEIPRLKGMNFVITYTPPFCSHSTSSLVIAMEKLFILLFAHYKQRDRGAHFLAVVAQPGQKLETHNLATSQVYASISSSLAMMQYLILQITRTKEVLAIDSLIKQINTTIAPFANFSEFQNLFDELCTHVKNPEISGCLIASTKRDGLQPFHQDEQMRCYHPKRLLSFLSQGKNLQQALTFFLSNQIDQLQQVRGFKKKGKMPQMVERFLKAHNDLTQIPLDRLNEGGQPQQIKTILEEIEKACLTFRKEYYNLKLNIDLDSLPLPLGAAFEGCFRLVCFTTMYLSSLADCAKQEREILELSLGLYQAHCGDLPPPDRIFSHLDLLILQFDDAVLTLYRLIPEQKYANNSPERGPLETLEQQLFQISKEAILEVIYTLSLRMHALFSGSTSKNLATEIKNAIDLVKGVQATSNHFFSEQNTQFQLTKIFSVLTKLYKLINIDPQRYSPSYLLHRLPDYPQESHGHESRMITTVLPTIHFLMDTFSFKRFSELAEQTSSLQFAVEEGNSLLSPQRKESLDMLLHLSKEEQSIYSKHIPPNFLSLSKKEQKKCLAQVILFGWERKATLLDIDEHIEDFQKLGTQYLQYCTKYNVQSPEHELICLMNRWSSLIVFLDYYQENITTWVFPEISETFRPVRFRKPVTVPIVEVDVSDDDPLQPAPLDQPSEGLHKPQTPYLLLLDVEQSIIGTQSMYLAKKKKVIRKLIGEKPSHTQMRYKQVGEFSNLLPCLTACKELFAEKHQEEGDVRRSVQLMLEVLLKASLACYPIQSPNGDTVHVLFSQDPSAKHYKQVRASHNLTVLATPLKTYWQNTKKRDLLDALERCLMFYQTQKLTNPALFCSFLTDFEKVASDLFRSKKQENLRRQAFFIKTYNSFALLPDEGDFSCIKHELPSRSAPTPVAMKAPKGRSLSFQKRNEVLEQIQQLPLSLISCIPMDNEATSEGRETRFKELIQALNDQVTEARSKGDVLKTTRVYTDSGWLLREGGEIVTLAIKISLTRLPIKSEKKGMHFIFSDQADSMTQSRMIADSHQILPLVQKLTDYFPDIIAQEDLETLALLNSFVQKIDRYSYGRSEPLAQLMERARKVSNLHHYVPSDFSPEDEEWFKELLTHSPIDDAKQMKDLLSQTILDEAMNINFQSLSIALNLLTPVCR